MKTKTASVALLVLSAFLTCQVTTRQVVAQAEGKKVNDRVWLYTDQVELVSITPVAERCGKLKGETIRFKVVSASAIDVRLAVKIGYKKWDIRDFPNQPAGAELTDYSCGRTPDYKLYTRPAGNNEVWPKP